MQVVVYADILFIFNAIVTFMLLNLTADFIKNEGDYRRMIIGAVVGGAYSFIIFAPDMRTFVAIIIRVIMLLSIVLISFRVVSHRKLLKTVVTFLLVSFVFSGIMYSAAFTVLKNRIIIKNGCIYFNTGPFGIIIFISICFILLKILRKTLLSKKNSDFIYELCLQNNDKSTIVKALYDSGNTVKDPFTGNAVIIINLESAGGVLENEVYSGISKLLLLKNFDALPDGVRLLPVNALGKSDLIPAVTVERAVIEYDSGEITVHNPTLAFTYNSFDDKRFSALINESVLKGDLIGIV